MNNTYKLLFSFIIGCLSGIAIISFIDIGILSDNKDNSGLGFVFIVSFIIFMVITIFIATLNIKLKNMETQIESDAKKNNK
tara:strand:+ start:252 stop:494 length:243 start_codon:yes stop_codon:yes gene_type:complete